MSEVVGPIGAALDRGSPVPLYFQVATQLQQMIESGELPVGGRLANEVELAEQLGVSRPTMRRAIQYLVERGMLVRKRGVGTQIVHPKVRRPVELTSLWDDLAKTGQEPRTELRGFTVGPATAAMAQTLGVPEGPPVTWTGSMSNFVLLPPGSVVFSTQPPAHLLPRVVAEVTEGRAGHPWAEVDAPALQHRIELAQQGIERLACVHSSAQRLHLAHHGLDGLAGRIGVDVLPGRASFPVALDTPAEEVEALVNMGDECLLLRQA